MTEDKYFFGDIIRVSSSPDGHNNYLLSRVGKEAGCLVCIATGNRWRDPVKIPKGISIDKAYVIDMIGEDSIDLNSPIKVVYRSVMRKQEPSIHEILLKRMEDSSRIPI